MSAEDFFQRARDQFGNRFDYSQSVYLDLKSPIAIICRNHGVFVTNTRNHLGSSAAGCPLCKIDMQVASRMRTLYPDWEQQLEWEAERDREANRELLGEDHA